MRRVSCAILVLTRLITLEIHDAWPWNPASFLPLPRLYMSALNMVYDMRMCLTSSLAVSRCSKTLGLSRSGLGQRPNSQPCCAGRLRISGQWSRPSMRLFAAVPGRASVRVRAYVSVLVWHWHGTDVGDCGHRQARTAIRSDVAT